MFREAIAAGSRIGMLATFAPAVPTMEDEFRQFAAETGSDATLETIVVPDAIDLLRKGDAESHNRLVAEAAPRFADHDAIMLAHFSTSRAAESRAGRGRRSGPRRAGGGGHAHEAPGRTVTPC